MRWSGLEHMGDGCGPCLARVWPRSGPDVAGSDRSAPECCVGEDAAVEEL